MIDTIVVLGANGMLGRQITTYFGTLPNQKVIPITRKEQSIDCNSWVPLEELFDTQKVNSNTCVINCIGYIPQRYTSTGAADQQIVNGIFPNILAKVCERYGAQMIQPTTDCVFSGKRGSYLETDFADETNHQGLAKSLGEPANATVIRVSIIGEELENKKSFLEWVKNSKGSIQGWTNHYWNGITCLEQCKVLDTIFTKNLFWKGVRHLKSPNTMSKQEMAVTVNTVFELGLEVKPIECKVIVDKTLESIQTLTDDLNIQPLEKQILDLKTFKLAEL